MNDSEQSRDRKTKMLGGERYAQQDIFHCRIPKIDRMGSDF
jgi:hypothetical protein